jgi:hypothetical protein
VIFNRIELALELIDKKEFDEDSYEDIVANLFEQIKRCEFTSSALVKTSIDHIT